MKKIKSILLIAVSLLMFSQFAMSQDTGKAKSDTVKYWVSMDCENCKAKVEKNIAFEKGVKDLKVDLKTKTVVVTYKPKKTNPEKLEKAIKKLGFEVEIIVPEKKKEGKKI